MRPVEVGHATTRWRRLACLVGALAACRPDATAPPAPPDDPAPPPPASATTAGADDVVATVDGAPILARDLDAAVGAQPAGSPERLAVLVDEALIRRYAAETSVVVGADELQRAIEMVATQNGLTVDELRAEVPGQTGLAWDQYRAAVHQQILEGKLLQLNVVPDGKTPQARVRAMEAGRERLVGCLRAAADIEIHRDLALPPNRYAQPGVIEGLTFRGDVVLPVAELEGAARAVLERDSVCANLVAVENAVRVHYGESGYLMASVQASLPEVATATPTLEVRVDAGARHVVGEVKLDQTAVDEARRIDERPARQRIDAHLRPGAIASFSEIDELSRLLQAQVDLHRGTALEVATDTHANGDDIVVDLTYRVVPSV